MFPSAFASPSANPFSRDAPYLLCDNFNTPLAAGSVNGTQAEPVGGARNVIDTEKKLSIAGGLMVGGSKASPTWSDPSLYYLKSLARVNGLTFIGKNIKFISNGRLMLGFANGAIDNVGNWRLTFYSFSNTSISAYIGSQSAVFAAISAGISYSLCGVLRSPKGGYIFIRGGSEFPNWTLLYLGGSDTAYTGDIDRFGVGNNVAADSVVIPSSLWLPTPLCYDTFTRADGAIGSSETVGPDGSGFPAQPVPSLAWTSQVGTLAIASNKAQFSALSTVGIGTVDTGNANVMIDAVLGRGAGNGGIVARYQNSSNYLIAYHDGTNVNLDKVVAGVTTNLISAAGTYGATYFCRLILDLTAARLYYNNSLIGTATVPSSTYTPHGLYTTDLTNTFDNFTLWARGNGNEYAQLDLM